MGLACYGRSRNRGRCGARGSLLELGQTEGRSGEGSASADEVVALLRHLGRTDKAPLLLVEQPGGLRCSCRANVSAQPGVHCTGRHEYFGAQVLRRTPRRTLGSEAPERYDPVMGVTGATWPLIGRQEELTAVKVTMDDASVSGLVLAGTAGCARAAGYLLGPDRADAGLAVQHLLEHDRLKVAGRGDLHGVRHGPYEHAAAGAAEGRARSLARASRVGIGVEVGAHAAWHVVEVEQLGDALRAWSSVILGAFQRSLPGRPAEPTAAYLQPGARNQIDATAAAEVMRRGPGGGPAPAGG
jgi:hypothetical protein